MNEENALIPENEEPEMPQAEEIPETEAVEEEEAPLEAQTPPPTDYEALAAQDLCEIKHLCSDFADVSHLCELPFAKRFAELRDLGLSVREALAASMPERGLSGAKDHLRTSVPRGTSLTEGNLSGEELRAAKDLFYGLSEKEINALYRRVTH